jgi:hypothetical protein
VCHWWDGIEGYQTELLALMLDRSHQEAERRLTSGSRPVNIWEVCETVTDAVSEALRVDCVWQLYGWAAFATTPTPRLQYVPIAKPSRSPC